MIAKVEAISFLGQHQPDNKLKEEEIKIYEDVRRFFVNNPDEKCIPLFLNSFGGKDGLGVYQLVDEVIWKYDVEKVMPNILEAFNSPHTSVRYWNVEISPNFPSKELFVCIILAPTAMGNNIDMELQKPEILICIGCL